MKCVDFGPRRAITTFSCMARRITPCTKKRATSTSTFRRDGGYGVPRGLERHLNALVSDAGSCPEIVLYQCGVDVLATDKLGRLSLSMAGMERDRLVFERCAERGIPVVCAMGGGYSPTSTPSSKLMSPFARPSTRGLEQRDTTNGVRARSSPYHPEFKSLHGRSLLHGESSESVWPIAFIICQSPPRGKTPAQRGGVAGLGYTTDLAWP